MAPPVPNAEPLPYRPESVPPITVWRDYNQRAGREEVVPQPDQDSALLKLCLKKCWSTEAALCPAVLGYNATQLFQAPG